MAVPWSGDEGAVWRPLASTTTHGRRATCSRCSGSLHGGVGAITNGLDLGHAPTRKQENQDDLIGGVEAQVLDLVVSGIEWLRRRGFSPAEVEQRFRANIETRKGAGAYRLATANNREQAFVTPADPGNLLRRLPAEKLAHAGR